MLSARAQRFFEIIPGAVAWLTLVLMVVCSWRLPTVVAVFIILFDIYWLLKTLYLFLHLRSAFLAMRANIRVNWLKKLEEREKRTTEDRGPAWRDLYHLVIFPMYREPYEVVRESVRRVAAARYPLDRLIVVLATEARGGAEDRATAERVRAEFGGRFREFLVTTHPAGLEGEIPGKGSNDAWAGREAAQLVDRLGIDRRHVLVSAFDVDTQVPSEYFARLTYVFLTVPNRHRAIYQPIPFYFNNIFAVSPFSRIQSFSSTFWELMQQARPERLTSFSSQSIPLTALLDVGFWERDVVSEDSRIFWQGYFHYRGDFRVEPLLYPVSLDANAAPTFWRSMANLYKQQRRWAWGVENVPYLIRRFGERPTLPLRKRCYWTFTMFSGFYSWATNSLMIFVLGWLPVVLGGREFNGTLLSYSLPHVTSFIVNLAMFGVATSAVLSLALLPKPAFGGERPAFGEARPAWFRARHYVLYVVEWLLVPVVYIVFGAIPALDAQTRLMLGGRWRLGFWVTPKARSEPLRS